MPGAVARLLLGKHAAGGAIRCLHATRIKAKPSQQAEKRWLLISAGAKEVQAAWELSFSDGMTSPESVTTEAPSDRLTADHESCHLATNGAANIPFANADAEGSKSVEGRWLATLPPPKVGLRPKRNVGFHAAVGERRTMSLCTFTVCAASQKAPEHCFVVQAASAGSLHIQKFCQRSLQWLQVAQLRHGSFVVLSIAAASVGAFFGADRQRMLVCAGSTEGNITFFDVSEVTQNEIDRSHASATEKSATTATAVENSLSCIEPLMTLPRLHQTGANAIIFTQVGELVWVVSGGDDQALAVTLLGPRDSDGDSHSGGTETLCVVETVTVDCAHVSAVKGLCSRVATGADGRCILQVCSIGWDEFLRVWQIDCCNSADASLTCSRGIGAPTDAQHLRRCSGKTVVVQEIANHGVDVCEPCCVAGCDSAASGGVWNVVVGGRGTELLSLHV